MIPWWPGISLSTIIAEAEARARMFRTSFDATLTTTRQPGPVVAKDGETTPNTTKHASMVRSMIRDLPNLKDQNIS